MLVQKIVLTGVRCDRDGFRGEKETDTHGESDMALIRLTGLFYGGRSGASRASSVQIPYSPTLFFFAAEGGFARIARCCTNT